MKNPKVDITQKILVQTGDTNSLEHALVSWWQNIRADGGYRLTSQGFDVFDNQFDSYQIELKNTKNITPKILLYLDKKIDYPYYIDRRKKVIHLFGSKEAMMVLLYGDIVTYLEKIEK